MTEVEAQKAIVSRPDAKSQNLTHYFTGKECKYGHVSLRLVSTRQCCECSKEYLKNNYEHLSAYKKQHKIQNAEKYKLSDKLNYEKNRDVRLKKMRAYAKNNKAIIFQNIVKRKASKKQRTPPWLTQEHKHMMVAVYKLSINKSECTGIEHHVDHIVPLSGKTVSGLHVPWNLQVLEASENRKKKNVVWPDMWKRIENVN